jgi:hypothetical protein
VGPLGPALALACRIVLAGVLAIAAAGKAAELAVAIALLVDFHSPVPGVAALVLLLAFSVFLVRTARRAAPCPCFGAVRTAAKTTAASAVVRNGVLVALAVLATGTAERARPLGTVVDIAVAAAVAGIAITRVA